MIWGLIGASNIAKEWMIGAIRSDPSSSIAAVMSNSLSHAQDYAKNNQIPMATDNLNQLLADKSIDAVYISSTNEKHFPQAMAAIAAGKHILCEKPLGMTIKEAAEMVNAAKQKSLIFATNHHLRNAGSHIAIQKLIASGDIGKVLSMRIHHAVYLPKILQGWRINTPSAGGGVILDIAVHNADTARFYLGEDPVNVVAKSVSSGLGNGVEDSAMSIWQMPSGAMIMSHESFTHKYTHSAIEVHGDKGSIYATNVMTQKPIGEVFLMNDTGRHQISYDDHNLYVRSLSLFADAVKGKGEPSASGVDGIKSLAVALAILKAAETGKTETVDYMGY